MLIRTLLPWHEAVWSHHFLGRSRPQSLLLTAVRGTGEAAFAHGAAASLLCADPTPQGLACGTCAECHWLDTGEHPDLKLLDPSRAATDAATAAEPAADDGDEKTKRSRELITVDDVRAATTFLQLAAHRGRARVVLIHPAHAMNVAAANALLKALEEPPTGAYFILVTSQPARLPATIRSRCIRVDLPKPDHAVAADWLQSQGIAQPTLALAQSGGAPIAAAELDGRHWEVRETLLPFLAGAESDWIGAAGRIKAEDLSAAVRILQTWCADLLGTSFGAAVRYHPDQARVLDRIGRSIEPLDVLAFERELLGARRLVEHPLNPKLFVEDLLSRYERLLQP